MALMYFWMSEQNSYWYDWLAAALQHDMKLSTGAAIRVLV